MDGLLTSRAITMVPCAKFTLFLLLAQLLGEQTGVGCYKSVRCCTVRSLCRRSLCGGYSILDDFVDREVGVFSAEFLLGFGSHPHDHEEAGFLEDVDLLVTFDGSERGLCYFAPGLAVDGVALHAASFFRNWFAVPPHRAARFRRCREDRCYDAPSRSDRVYAAQRRSGYRWNEHRCHRPAVCSGECEILGQRSRADHPPSTRS